MNLSVSFELTSRLLALSGFLSLLLTGELNLPFIVIPILALSLSLFQTITGRSWILSRRVWNGFTLLAFLFFLIDYQWIAGSLLMASTHFLILLMANKLFNLEVPHDHLQLYIISFLGLLAASALTIDFIYALTFLLFLFVGVWALMMYHLTVEQKAHARQEPLPGGRRGRSPVTQVVTLPFFLMTNGLALGSFFLTLMIFFFIPRISIGLMHQKKEDLVRLSGFSEQVDLGALGSIKLDPTVVMRIELPGNTLPESQIYWRGGSYDYYDGFAWKNSFGHGRSVLKDFSDRFLIHPVTHLEKTLRQEIFLEPLDTAVVFAASQPVAIESNRLNQLNANEMDVLHLNFLPAARLQYTAYSKIPALDREDRRLEHWDYSSSLKDTYLQLPAISPQIGQLAEEVTQRASTIYEKALLIKNYLQFNFRYSLEVTPPPEGMLPIEDFLLRQKTGYCEYYATAMVLMLRHLGIPTRLATGFLPGEWNNFGNYYLVRQQDAHSWVEVYFPRSGWITFDPTPSAGPEYHPAVLSTLSKYLDALRLKWDRYIVRFSFQDQIELAKDVKTRTDSLRVTLHQWAAWMKTALDSIKEAGLAHRKLVLAGLAIGLSILAWILHFRKGWSGLKFFVKKPSGTAHAVRFYAELLEILTACGFHKDQTQTPKEFALLIRSRAEAIYRPVLEITLAYYHLRFGHRTLSSDDEERIKSLLLSIRQETEKKPA